jgi:hypothetical protein
MADTPALNATFFAFRKREKAVLLPASIVFAVLAVIVGGVFAALNWQAFVDYMNWAASMGTTAAQSPESPPDMTAMMPPQSVMNLMPAYFLFLLLYYILLASYEAACLRWMIRGEAPGLFGLSLGADTWRVYFTYWIWFLLLMAFYIVCLIAAGGAMMSLFAVGQGGAEALGSMIGIPLLIGLLVLLLLVYFSVRFAPAAATSIARKKFAFFDAWTVTKGRFWALLGSFVLLFLMFFVLIIVLEVGLGVAMASMAMSQIGQTEPQTAEEAFRAFANPQWMALVGVFIGVITIASFVFYIALFGINARAAQAALEEGKITAGA